MLLLLFAPQFSQILVAQEVEYKYWVLFEDKAGSTFSIDQPEAFLSDRSIERRNKQGIAITEQDLPVNSNYLNDLLLWNNDFTILHFSNWFNAACIQFVGDSMKTALTDLTDLDFVKDTLLLSQKFIDSGKTYHDKFELEEAAPEEDWDISEIDDDYYGPGIDQLNFHNAVDLHDAGYKGQGMVIAVCDNGFKKSDVNPFMEEAFSNGQILSAQDIVEVNDPSVYDSLEANHGARVLSVMASNLPGEFVGSAPLAEYRLYATEESGSEQRIEEINWIVAAEHADISGADLITTSLGYSLFDYESYNYSTDQMNGDIAYITQAADIAASKGMIIVNSAGNSGSSSWRIITPPADGDNVIAVGAYDRDTLLASFSSQGPAADGRVKPDVMALGVSTNLIHEDGYITTRNGTSFSGPLMAGLIACLWQSVPDKTAEEVKQALFESSSQYESPDSLFGYGIPDFKVAFDLLDDGFPLGLDENKIEIFQKSYFYDQSFYFVPTESGEMSVLLRDANGKQVMNWDLNVSANILQQLDLTLMEQFPQGMYFIQTLKDGKQQTRKILKSN